MSRFSFHRHFIALAILIVTAIALAACQPVPSPTPAAAPAEAVAEHTMEMAATDLSSPASQLHGAMRKLWADHMQWTYITVDNFFNNEAALQPALDRLLLNQKHIGQAIAPYYGQEAADKLAELLTEHITGAVPVLTAAKTGDEAGLDQALADWHANAKEIANFLSAANPEHWPPSATEPMLKQHIDTTVAYSVDLLKGDYAAAIQHYDEAYDHMMMLADTLAQGLVASFPEKF
ncbi:MAG: hypothetical protein BWY52_03266 [Chloroflexi bacterium ADurb.Bin325]|nr:MAG: hypothetical protein BWY52_03266 [Chloroflexi bacterium ADurb.Bin325]